MVWGNVAVLEDMDLNVMEREHALGWCTVLPAGERSLAFRTILYERWGEIKVTARVGFR